MLSLDHRIIQMIFERQVQTHREQMVATAATSVSANVRLDVAVGEGAIDDRHGGYLAPPPAYAPPEQRQPVMAGTVDAMDKSTPIGSGLLTLTCSMLSSGDPSATDSIMSAPPTPTPTRATFVAEETETRSTRSTTTKTETISTHPSAPNLMKALKEVRRVQDSVDAAADEAALRGTLAGALSAKNDVEMVRRLQVAPGEIPEAAETLRRTLAAGTVEVDRNQRTAPERGEHGADVRDLELDRKFMQSGIDAMMRLTNMAAKQPRGDEPDQGAGAAGASKLPSWTITRYDL